MCYYVHRKRAYIQQRLSGHTPSHVSRAPRPGTRARGERRHRGPRRAREAQARKNEPTELRRSGRSMPNPSTPQTARRAHEAHEAHRCEALAAKTRQETVALSSAMSRAEEPAHRSKQQGTALVIHEDRSGRNAARRTRVGKTLRVRPREFQESGSSLCSSRKPTRARGAERGV